MRGLRTTVVVAAVLLGLAGVSHARRSVVMPDLLKGGTKDDKHDWNLGPTGARGWIWGRHLETTAARQILITKVDSRSPADGVLREGDVVIGIDGKLFTSYIYGDDKPKPSLVPVRTTSGIEVTRRYPITRLKGGSDDHTHHVGLFFSVDYVNKTEFWNNTKSSPQIKHIKTKEAKVTII